MPVKPEPYDVGDELELELVFTDAADDPKDPSTASLEIDCPDGTLLTFTHPATLTRDSEGVFSTTYTVANGTGRYRCRGIGTGALAIVEPRTFHVRELE